MGNCRSLPWAEGMRRNEYPESNGRSAREDYQNRRAIDQKDHLGEVVPGTVEETLNGLLDAEADRLCNAKRYERTDSR